MNIIIKIFVLVFFVTFTAQCQLAVFVSPVKATAQKAIVQLSMTNNLAEPIESARAACFILDGQGKLVGESSKWVIGQNKVDLASGAANTFTFVVSCPQPFATTNLTAKVNFTRILLTGGHIADVGKVVKITNQ